MLVTNHKQCTGQSKIDQIHSKSGCVIKINQVKLCTKHSHCIMHQFLLICIKKFECTISLKYAKLEQNLVMTRRITFNIKVSNRIVYVVYRDTSKAKYLTI